MFPGDARLLRIGGPHRLRRRQRRGVRMKTVPTSLHFAIKRPSRRASPPALAPHSRRTRAPNDTFQNLSMDGISHISVTVYCSANIDSRKTLNSYKAFHRQYEVLSDS